MNFSERMGFKEVSTVLQTNGMNDVLRHTLWNVLDERLWNKSGFMHDSNGNKGTLEHFSRKLWADYFKKPMDTIPRYPSENMQYIRDYFMKCPWNEVYDFLEFTVLWARDEKLINRFNCILDRELAGYRIISQQVVPVTDPQEVESIESAINTVPFAGVTAHINNALEHLSRRESPDYRNSIKESISAVESIARELSGNPKATLGEALAVIERKGSIHPALRKSLNALYGYTSDEQGIRHSMLDEPNLTASDAKFFLVACASFINYLKSKI